MAETINVIMTTDYQEIVTIGDNESYSLQNIGKNKIELLFSDTEPIASDKGHVLETLKIANLTWGNGTIWARVKEAGGGTLSVTPYTYAQDVNVQDQTSPVLISQMNQKVGDNTLAVATAIEDTSITVADATGIIVGHLIVISTPEGRTYVGKVTNIAGAPVLVLDTPINVVFPIGTQVNFGTTEMNVVGTLAAPQIFSVRGTGGNIPITIDITRIIFTMVTVTAVDLLKFGDLAILINGLVLRRTDGIISNIVNIKSNAAFANIAYDFTVYAATNPQQGVDGFVCRLTFAGQNKIGVAIRLEQDEDLELLVQDNLTGITEFSAVVEGHVVID